MARNILNNIITASNLNLNLNTINVDAAPSSKLVPIGHLLLPSNIPATTQALVSREVNIPIKSEEITLDNIRADEVLIDIHTTSIYNTDLSYINGRLPGAFPYVFGYEGATYGLYTFPTKGGLGRPWYGWRGWRKVRHVVKNDKVLLGSITAVFMASAMSATQPTTLTPFLRS
ncbi:hypothetical protein N7465_002742 [Penicillium sp. CMV-2018d]|nr:hypothetical protein N7465_002742 [Penicillium sp. CMV-2018d]